MTLPTPAQVLASESWMDEANCRYGNKDVVAGVRVFDDAGAPVLTYEEFTLAMDKLFHAAHDSRYGSGDESTALHRAVTECLRCPVQAACLEYALATRPSTENGVYGGTTKWERKTVMYGPTFEQLTPEEKVRVLQRLVEAKAMGWVRRSVPIDQVDRMLRTLPDEEWDRFAEASYQRDVERGVA